MTTRQRCFDLIQSLEGYGHAVPACNIHITLLFLGETEENQLQTLLEAASSVAFKLIHLCFDQMSYWQKPAVCCLTPSVITSPILDLVEQLQQLVVVQKIPREILQFQPHITLLRKSIFVPPEVSFQPIMWDADVFCLLESCATASGVRYRVLNSWTTH
jgi:2'-5' RNA ligase